MVPIIIKLYDITGAYISESVFLMDEVLPDLFVSGLNSTKRSKLEEVGVTADST